MEMQIESYFSTFFVIFSTETNGKLNLIDGDREGTVLTEFFKRISSDLRTKTEKLNSS